MAGLAGLGLDRTDDQKQGGAAEATCTAAGCLLRLLQCREGQLGCRSRLLQRHNQRPCRLMPAAAATSAKEARRSYVHALELIRHC